MQVVAFLHNVLDLVGHKFIIVLRIVLENTFYEFNPFLKSLVLYIEVVSLSVFLLQVSLDTLDIGSEISVCFEKICNCINTVY